MHAILCFFSINRGVRINAEVPVEMKKKISVFGACALALALILGGCSSSGASADEEAETTQETAANSTEESETPALPESGGTGETAQESVNDMDVYSAVIDDESAEIFTEASHALLGVSYEPLRLLATQIVSGTNYAYLCRAQVSAPDASPYYAIVAVYKDLEGNISVLSANEISLDDIHTTEDSNSGLAGGWEIAGSGKPGALSEAAESALNNAVMAYTGMNFMPLILLSRGQDDGITYKYLCIGQTVTPSLSRKLVIVDVKESLSSSEITDVQTLDLGAYITY